MGGFQTVSDNHLTDKYEQGPKDKQILRQTKDLKITTPKSNSQVVDKVYSFDGNHLACGQRGLCHVSFFFLFLVSLSLSIFEMLTHSKMQAMSLTSVTRRDGSVAVEVMSYYHPDVQISPQ